MGKLQKNQVCRICERNGKPNVFVDIQWLDEINPKTGKNRSLFLDPVTALNHQHHEKANSYTTSTRPNDIGRLQRSEEVALLYKRLKDVELELKAIRTTLDNLAF
jgi:hypothetical protein